MVVSEPDTNARDPRVSVVMTVYRDFRFFDAAVESVLGQDFADLELIIIDDGNNDPDRFAEAARRDPRIRVLSNPTNVGAAVSANRGIEIARADIIARLDADDLCEPTRIGRQVAALDRDPALGFVGSAVTLIDENDRPLGIQVMPESDLDIRWTILFYNPFYHSSVAFRKSLFEGAGRYIPSELISQDHYLWFQMLPLCRAQNLSEPLVRYRLNTQGLTATNTVNARARTDAIRTRLWEDLGLQYDGQDEAVARDISSFLAGHGITDGAGRLTAYRQLIRPLRPFLAAAGSLPVPPSADDVARLRQRVLGGIRAFPPAGLRDKLEVAKLLWPISPRTAVALFTDVVQRKLRGV